jgi:hypothetical protein
MALKEMFLRAVKYDIELNGVKYQMEYETI